jgi:gliding motility-associated protein GldM
MALPKEPRQKMINMMYLVLTALLALNVSSEILNAFKVVDQSLITSNTNIAEANNTIYKSLTDKLNDQTSAADARIWQPLAEKAKALSADMDTYINQLKQELKKEADLEVDDKGNPVLDENGNQKFREDNLDAATRLFGTNGRGKELEARLKQYREALLNLHPEIREKFGKTLPVDIGAVKGMDGKEKDFTTGYFYMTPTVAALTMLSKFQNNVKNAENQVVSHFHSKIGAVVVKYDKFGVLVGQSSNYVMPGQEVTVTAGVGAYSAAAEPIISIGGSTVQTVNGAGTYKVTASGSGERTVPVTIRYKDQQGNMQTATATVKYVVGTPGGAAVMLDKMNVFYIGVDNPVTISSGTGWDKTSVSMTGGTISGNNGKFTVRVSSPGTASITVNSDGKPSTFQFRVKRIPDPVIKIGNSGGGRVQSVMIKNQPAVRAELENFDFDARFSVVGATVYFTGAGFPNVATAQITSGSLAPLAPFMARSGPGTSIIFDNVRVQGPDGQVRSIQSPGFALF